MKLLKTLLAALLCFGSLHAQTTDKKRDKAIAYIRAEFGPYNPGSSPELEEWVAKEPLPWWFGPALLFGIFFGIPAALLGVGYILQWIEDRRTHFVVTGNGSLKRVAVVLFFLFTGWGASAQTGTVQAPRNTVDTLRSSGTFEVLGTLRMFLFDSNVARINLVAPKPKVYLDYTYSIYENRKAVRVRVVVFTNMVAEVYKNGIKQ
jgi:hypothetical protein